MTEQDVERIVAMVMDLTLGNARPEMVRGRVIAGHADKHLAAIPNKQEKALGVAREALGSISQWYDGPVVGSWFDEPTSAGLARKALSTIDEIVGN